MMDLSDYHYELVDDLIASFPLEKRSSSRLLCLNKANGCLKHGQFTDLKNLLHPGDLLVCNNTRVIPARLFGHKPTGGVVEILVERITGEHTLSAHVRASKSPRVGTEIIAANDVRFVVLGRQDDLFVLNCRDPRPVLQIIEALGQTPLPPYFNREPNAEDQERYQTVYAAHKGSVAAPTAGLHFDTELLHQLAAKGVNIAYLTLHVGAGTFAPVRVTNIAEHKMHAEYVDVPESLVRQIQQTKSDGGRVIAVGTTTLRSLETAALSGEIKPYTGDTQIFIYPGFQFHCVDALITNFHLPGSTLLMLVAAFAGYEHVMQAYKKAVAERYRFFSYGDAMFIA